MAGKRIFLVPYLGMLQSAIIPKRLAVTDNKRINNSVITLAALTLCPNIEIKMIKIKIIQLAFAAFRGNESLFCMLSTTILPP